MKRQTEMITLDLSQTFASRIPSTPGWGKKGMHTQRPGSHRHVHHQESRVYNR